MDRTVSLLLRPLLMLSVTISLGYGTKTDIYCLETLKASLEDPSDSLASWNFTNGTEGFICSFNGIECWHPDENKVLNIWLSDRGLKGEFPRGLENCTSMTGLNLSNNNLYGSLPLDISKKLKFITSLDLSSNNFSGEFPKGLSNCTYLNVLKLDNNHFSGQIPLELGLLSRLKTFSVTNNCLSGQVPTFSNSTVGVDSYANNDGLCGEPLPLCKKASPKTTFLNIKFHGRFIGRFAAGCVFGVFLGVGVFLCFCYRVSPKKNKKIKKKKKKKKKKYVQGTKWPKIGGDINENKILFPKKEIIEMGMRDLIVATNNFSKDNIIGIGTTGTMYKGILPSGTCVAVKKFQNSQFTSELITLGTMGHRNVVPLLGFSIYKKKRFLVYKYMPNGSLHDWLHLIDNGTMGIDFLRRLRISIDLARGFAWLHHNCKRCIIHGNFNSKYVLFDENFEPKISNFRHSMFINFDDDYSIASDNNKFEVFGCVAYDDMEAMEPSPKKDVYSFGLVLLELINGVNPTQDSFSGPLNYVDKSLLGNGCDGDIFLLLRVANQCVESSPNEMPTMFEVYQTLQAIGEKYFPHDDDEIEMVPDSCDVDFLFGLK